MRNQQLVSPSRLCCSTPIGCDYGFFLAKNIVTTQEHPPYSPDLASTDFYLFPRLKSTLKGRSLCNAIDIITNETGELKRLAQIDFQKCFQHLYMLWRKYAVAKVDYFEENAA
jgi:hypothetical protein